MCIFFILPILYLFCTAGVLEYWLVDPGKNRVIIHNFEQDTMEKYSFTDDVPSALPFGESLSKFGKTVQTTI